MDCEAVKGGSWVIMGVWIKGGFKTADMDVDRRTCGGEL